ncbi:efflux RND transporter periplasmic adaptor subunit [Cereibacter sphaeroides]|uniref:efflux RND transporter periplasmic adaptor subunit n=1 Tax=Cereibacter sphaeroides TaxID=1063 RepID=UPI001F3BFD4B|nr:efflux RND transporter periplasmic adaptor subunit [Cereibacter sphaeroides]MCE6949811.1 efflux RND transporter periplasmic adaptor subunit [Cereibacter sphaeroides]
MTRLIHAALLVLMPLHALAEPLAYSTVTDWKAVYGRIEARDRIPARSRLGGTLVSLAVTEGDRVTAGQVLAEVVDEKIGFQLAAVDAEAEALKAELDNARTELKRVEDLLARGVSTTQQSDALRTQVQVLTGRIAANRAERQVLEQQSAEGRVLAPIAGRVLDVPVAAGAVVLSGEEVATIGGGGFFLRLAVPERHAAFLKQGDPIGIEGAGGGMTGKLARIYPLIENGRVIADVDVPGLSDAFVDARLLVRLPVGERQALLVPASAVRQRSGLDFVAVRAGEAAVERTVILGPRHEVGGRTMVEVLTGLQPGDDVVTTDE